MSYAQPVDVVQLQDIASLGIDPQNCSFLTLTMESDNFICIREIFNPPNGKASVAFIDLENRENFSRHSISADSLLMNPVSRVVALRSGMLVQLFETQSKSKLVSYTMPQQVLFWRWLNQTTIALVTQFSVYHWNVSSVQSKPIKIFDRNSQLDDYTIISYVTDPHMSFCALVGLKKSPTGVIVGQIQLYSIEKVFSQMIEGLCAIFTTYDLPNTVYQINLFAFVCCINGIYKLIIREVSRFDTVSNHPVDPGSGRFGQIVELCVPDESNRGEFPISLIHGLKYSFLFVVTKLGILFVVDTSLGRLIYTSKIVNESDAVFLTAPKSNNTGFVFVTRSGKVSQLTINEQSLISYLTSKNMLDVAIELVSRGTLPGSESLYTRQFQNYIQERRYQDAAMIAARTPNGVLRQSQTIKLFKSLQARPNEPPPILQYFGALLERTKLNSLESVELVQLALAQNRKDLLERWLKDDKLELSKELGVLIQRVDLKLALSVFIKADCKENVVMILSEMGQIENLLLWCQKQNYSPDWVTLLEKMSRTNSKVACKLAKFLFLNDPSLIEVTHIVDIFMRLNMVEELTDFAIETRLDDVNLQTVVLELNFLQNPVLARELLDRGVFKCFNQTRIAELTERLGDYSQALLLYEDSHNQDRILQKASLIPSDTMIHWFSTLSPTRSLECLNVMLSSDLAQNLSTVVSIADAYFQELGLHELVKLFEAYGSHQGIYDFLTPILSIVDDTDIFFKYIESATQLGQTQQLDRILEENFNLYDAKKVYEFLKQSMLSDPHPIITVARKHGFMDDLIRHFNNNGVLRGIEIYVTEIDPQSIPHVIGVLLEDYVSDDYIRYLVDLMGPTCDVSLLFEQLEKHKNLKVVQSWVEARIQDGSRDALLHNTLAKIYIENNYDPDNMLTTDKYYDHSEVGRYCESRDTQLAYEIYVSSNGQCDRELVRMCIENEMFSKLVEYLIHRQDVELWEFVLNLENERHHADIIEEIKVLLPRCSNLEKVMTAVRALSSYKQSSAVISVLKKLVFNNENTEIFKCSMLQETLIMKAIDHEDANVTEFIKSLDRYDSHLIAKYAYEHGLHTEAFECYRRHGQHERAIEVLISSDTKTFDHAVNYATQVDNPKVYSILAKAQLERGELADAVSNFIRAKNFQHYSAIISACNSAISADPSRMHEINEYKIRYLELTRKVISESKVDTELLYVYAVVGRLQDFESTLATTTNKVYIQDLGERLFHEGLYDAAKVVFASVNNNNRLALIHVKLGDLAAAVNVAASVNSLNVWRVISEACIANEEWTLAQKAGLNVVTQNEGLLSTVKQYESKGCFKNLLEFLEVGVQNSKSHPSIFTELAIAYANYEPQKLAVYLEKHYGNLNISRIVAACERNLLWNELLYILEHDKLYDRCITLMMEHASVFELSSFLSIIPRVKNTSLIMSSIRFFINEHPTSLNAFLEVIEGIVDVGRIIKIANELDVLPLIKEFLLRYVNSSSSESVKEAMVNLFIQEEDFESLRKLFDENPNIDSLSLARTLESHPLVEFRRLAAHIYNCRGKYDLALELLKKGKFYEDAVSISCNLSQSSAESFLEYLLKQKLYQIYAAVLYAVYSVVRPDVVLELAWTYNAMSFTYPYFIQLLRDYDNLIKSPKTTTPDTNSSSELTVAQRHASPLTSFNNNSVTSNVQDNSLTVVPRPNSTNTQMSSPYNQQVRLN